MENKTNSIRNGIIITVVGGILLAILTRIFSGVLDILKSIWNWLLSGFIYVKEGLWSYLQSSITIPYGLLWLLIILSIIALWKLLYPVISPFIKKGKMPKPYKPRLKDYREDMIFNIKWEWSDIYGTLPSKTTGFCSVCATRLVYSINGYPQKTSCICENCGRTIVTLEGDLDYAHGTVKREIERRIKTNEWQRIVMRQHKQKAV